MTQVPPRSQPTFAQIVFGTMIGNVGCLLAYLVLAVCMFAVFGAALAPRLQDLISRSAPFIR